MTLTDNAPSKKISSFVGGGYNEFWKFKGRYRVCKGSRASKKSKTTALWYATWLNKEGYEQANLIVFRKTFRTIKDSCFTDLKWALEKLGVIDDWNITMSPLEMTRKSTGQKILFRGLDDTLKVTSITVEKGVLCWAWLEEAYEVMKEEDFDILDESIRGECLEPLFKQWTITFNPWNEHHWLKKRFFDAEPDSDILAMTTNYLCNEWLDAADKKVFETMKKNNPRRYQVAGLGQWGIVDGLVYDRWEERNFTLITKAEYERLGDKPADAVYSDGLKTLFGLDFGYTNDPSALFCGMIDTKNKVLYVFDEMYKKGMSNEAIAEEITRMGYSKERITADSAEPKSIARLRILGIGRIRAALKGPDSIRSGIDFLQDYKIYIHPKCVNFITEIGNYTWAKDKFGNKLNVPIDDFNHLMDAMRYGVEDYSRNREMIFG